MKIKKRSGKTEKFIVKKIIDSITRANNSVDDEYTKLNGIEIEEIANSVYNKCNEFSNNGIIGINLVEDKIEDALINSINGKETAKQYIKYRYEKEQKKLKDVITTKLMAKHVENQNANVDEKSYGGRQGETASYITKDYALKYMMSDLARNNHENNEIYIHDLDHYALGDHNCLSIPFDDLLENGFNTGQTDIRQAGSISTAMQLVAVIFQIQSLQQFGGVAATHIDHTMVPYVRKSFFKHFKDGLKYIEGLTNEEIDDFLKSFDEKK